MTWTRLPLLQLFHNLRWHGATRLHARILGVLLVAVGLLALALPGSASPALAQQVPQQAAQPVPQQSVQQSAQAAQPTPQRVPQQAPPQSVQQAPQPAGQQPAVQSVPQQRADPVPQQRAEPVEPTAAPERPASGAAAPSRPTNTPLPPPPTPTTQVSWFNATEVPREATAAPVATLRATPLPFSAVDHAIATATGTTVAAQTAAPIATGRAGATATTARLLAQQATSTVVVAVTMVEVNARATATSVTFDVAERAAASAFQLPPQQQGQPSEQDTAITNMLSRMRLTGPADGQNLVAPPGRVLPTPIPIRYAGLPSASREAEWVNSTTLWLGVPHRTQFDDSLYGPTNCGPTSLGMVFEAYGLKTYPTDAIRGEVNRISGDFSPNNGTSLGAIAVVAQRAGLHPMDLYQRPGSYKRWTIEDVRAHLKEGRPIITLTRYADLPGNSYYGSDINHYIVLSGLSGDQIIYNDSAYSQGRGRGLLISPEALQRAWANSNMPGHSMAFALNASGEGLLSPLARRGGEALGEGDTVEIDDELATELRGLARAIILDPPPALAGDSGGAVLASGGSFGSLVLSASSDRESGVPAPGLALLALAGYATLAVGLVLPRLRTPRRP
jgi:hypothetical protein